MLLICSVSVYTVRRLQNKMNHTCEGQRYHCTDPRFLQAVSHREVMKKKYVVTCHFPVKIYKSLRS